MNKSLIAILCVVIVILIGALAFVLGKNSVGIKQETNQSVQSPVQASPTSGTNPTSIPLESPKKTITAGGIGVFPLYNADIPEDWSSTRETPPEQDKLTLSKNGYSIIISQAAGGGGGCTYPGEAPQQFAQSFSSFVQVESSFGNLYRRGPSDPTSFTYCEKRQGSFGFPTTYGYITLKTPVNVSQDIMTEADSIISSLNKK